MSRLHSRIRVVERGCAKARSPRQLGQRRQRRQRFDRVVAVGGQCPRRQGRYPAGLRSDIDPPKRSWWRQPPSPPETAPRRPRVAGLERSPRGDAASGSTRGAGQRLAVRMAEIGRHTPCRVTPRAQARDTSLTSPKEAATPRWSWGVVERRRNGVPASTGSNGLVLIGPSGNTRVTTRSKAFPGRTCASP